MSNTSDTFSAAAAHNNDSSTSSRLIDTLGLSLDDVVVIFACNDLYVPFLSVVLQSIGEHINPNRHYDVVVLANQITPQNMEILRNQVAEFGIGIGFLDVSKAFESYKLPIHGHFKRETYFRLLAPEMLAPLKKSLYLDCDLVVLRDIAELFDTPVKGKLLAAARDADTVGQAYGYYEHAKEYLASNVDIDNPLDYFQAGVLVLNLEEFRSSFSTAELFELAASRHWQWLDQDVLNYLAHDRYTQINMSWNTLMDWEHIRRERIIAQAPQFVQDEYEAARKNPSIVHYAGPDDRPWLYPKADMAEYFWDYASRSPYYQEIKHRLHASRTTPKGILKRAQVFILYRIGMDLFDVLFKPKTKRRRFMISAFRVVGGHLI
ncbi:MAG: glycosyltransferase family 8 protein [Coriobacteriales bacterium]|nr:glycosyltransferase family 8 protein [Coriobacteriales bacterium]